MGRSRNGGAISLMTTSIALQGERDKLIGRLQERYGYARERAEEEVDRRFSEYERTAR